MWGVDPRHISIFGVFFPPKIFGTIRSIKLVEGKTMFFFLKISGIQIFRYPETEHQKPPGNGWLEYYFPIPIGSMYGIYTYIYHKKQPNVDKYTSPMDPMGLGRPIFPFGIFGLFSGGFCFSFVYMQAISPSENATKSWPP